MADLNDAETDAGDDRSREAARLAQALANMPALVPGTVVLAGAGPGDPRYLTLAALRALGQADAVVHDALVELALLALIPPRAERHDVGKRGGRPSTSQAEIDGLLVRLAREGKRVVRLKGGDPVVFGRGGEEMIALAAAGVPCLLIPGVTAAFAGLAEAGIPATLRGVNRAVILATGHSLQDGPSALDWEALARLGQPMLFYMALRHLPEIAARLRAGGLPGETPALMMAAVTTQSARYRHTTLDGLADAVDGFQGPAIIAIGEIVAFPKDRGQG
ncbi:MAG: uroporphyrinogen-III C-methyltransferase [Pseudomonadota bacterium]